MDNLLLKLDMNKRYILLLVLTFVAQYNFLRFQNENLLDQTISDALNQIFPEHETVVLASLNMTLFPVKLILKYHVLTLDFSKQIKWGYNSKLKNFILDIQDISNVSKFLATLQTSYLWNSRAYYLILCKNVSNFQRIFQILWRHNILYTAVLVYEENKGNLNIVSGSPFGQNLCGKLTHYSYVRNFSSLSRKPPFDLQGCSLIICTLEQLVLPMPFTGNDTLPGIYDGSIKLIAKALNLSVNLESVGYWAERAYMDGTLHWNDPPYINYDLLLTTANRYDYYYEWYDLTDVFFYDDYVWTIAKPKHTSNTKTLFIIFSLQTWGVILLVIILCSIIITTIEYIYEGKLELVTSLFHMFSITVAQESNKIPTHLALVVILEIYTFYSLIIYHLFQGKLSSLLTKPGFEKGINTVAEMADSELIPVLYPHIRRTYVNTTYPILKKIYEKSKHVREIQFDRIRHVISGNISTPFYKVFLEYDAEHYSQVKVIGTDYLMHMEASFNFRKDHPFLDTFNSIISMIDESGLQKKLLKSIFPHKRIFSDSEGHVKLSFQHVTGSFVILSMGLIASLFIFMAELLIGQFASPYNRRSASSFSCTSDH